MSDEEGVWVSYSLDVDAVGVAPHASELEALRTCNQRSYGSVIFVPFGVSVDDAINAEYKTSRRAAGDEPEGEKT